MRDHPVRAVFLDRDGVINRNRPDYVKAWEEFEFLPGALKALERLAGSPFYIVVVTNQSAVGRGLLSWQDLEEIHARMEMEIRQAGGRLNGVYCCPHTPADLCDCRKPSPGLLLRAAKDLNLDLGASWLIGDSLNDVAAAQAVGVRPILVNTRQSSTMYPDSALENGLVCNGLDQAIEFLPGRAGA